MLLLRIEGSLGRLGWKVVTKAIASSIFLYVTIFVCKLFLYEL